MANELPSLRLSRVIPSWVSAQAFSQLSQPMQVASLMTSTSVASPRPCAIKKAIIAEAPGCAWTRACAAAWAAAVRC